MDLRDLYLLKPGASGMQVERLQSALKERGLYGGPVDGDRAHYTQRNDVPGKARIAHRT